MLATDKQINYLCYLAEKAEKMRNYIDEKLPGAIKEKKCIFINWQTERYLGVTIEDASIRIKAYKNIIAGMNMTLALLGYKQL